MSFKKLEVFIKPFRLEPLKNALTEAGIGGMTIIETNGFGRQQGHQEIYRGEEHTVDFAPKILVILYAEENQVPDIIKIINENARTGSAGDGKIFISPVDEVIRISTGESGEAAL